MPWLLNEDAALKAKLQGLRVIDANSGVNGRPVPVRYRLPETEPSDLTFPIIVISHNGWYYAAERAHDGAEPLPYAPEGLSPWWDDTDIVTGFDPNDSPYIPNYFPIPYNLDYRVTVYSRFMHEHTIPIVSALAGDNYLHAKYGYLNIPQDGTKRTLQLLGGPDLFTEKDNNDKRLFRVEYVVRVFSELVPALVNYVMSQSINLNFSVYADTQDLTGPTLTKSKGILSVGKSATWNVAQPQI
jgi:hypothetical protein